MNSAIFKSLYNEMVSSYRSQKFENKYMIKIVVVVVLLFYVHGKHLRSCREGQLT